MVTIYCANSTGNISDWYHVSWWLNIKSTIHLCIYKQLSFCAKLCERVASLNKKNTSQNKSASFYCEQYIILLKDSVKSKNGNHRWLCMTFKPSGSIALETVMPPWWIWPRGPGSTVERCCHLTWSNTVSRNATWNSSSQGGSHISILCRNAVDFSETKLSGVLGSTF